MARSNVTNPSLWISDTEDPVYPSSAGTSEADIAVIGGGITGLTTALLLQQGGARVVLLEAGAVCSGVTAFTTGKVTSLHGLIYGQLRETFGADTARIYGAANEAALAEVARLVDTLQIDCDFERRPNYTYTTEASRVPDLEREAEAAVEAGLPASFTTQIGLPFEVQAAVRFENQAQFHARKYVLALARAFVKAGGVVYQDSRVVGVDAAEGICTIHDGSRVNAKQIVLATQIPILDRGGYFAKTHPMRSYLMAFETDAAPLEGMYLSEGQTSWTLRTAERGRYLLVGGQQHKTGHEPDTVRRYDAIERYAREHFQVGRMAYRWSAQDYMPVDHMPYIGKLPFGGDRVWVATGYGKWGLSNGTLAALIIRDGIEGRANAWAETFDAKRVDVGASAKQFVSENWVVAKDFVKGRFRDARGKQPRSLGRGEGGVIETKRGSAGGYRDEQGRLHAVSLVCTHLGCHVTWNSAERSWDCPCHGSRFGVNGEVLDGPAVRALERVEVREDEPPQPSAPRPGAP